MDCSLSSPLSEISLLSDQRGHLSLSSSPISAHTGAGNRSLTLTKQRLLSCPGFPHCEHFFSSHSWPRSDQLVHMSNKLYPSLPTGGAWALASLRRLFIFSWPGPLHPQHLLKVKLAEKRPTFPHLQGISFSIFSGATQSTTFSRWSLSCFPSSKYVMVVSKDYPTKSGGVLWERCDGCGRMENETNFPLSFVFHPSTSITSLPQNTTRFRWIIF